jgi:hypothetical protein
MDHLADCCRSLEAEDCAVAGTSGVAFYPLDGGGEISGPRRGFLSHDCDVFDSRCLFRVFAESSAPQAPAASSTPEQNHGVDVGTSYASPVDVEQVEPLAELVEREGGVDQYRMAIKRLASREVESVPVPTSQSQP